MKNLNTAELAAFETLIILANPEDLLDATRELNEEERNNFETLAKNTSGNVQFRIQWALVNTRPENPFERKRRLRRKKNKNISKRTRRR